MTQFLRLAALALLLPGFAWAQAVKIPAEVTGAVGSFVVIQAETTDPLVKWHSIDAGLNLFPPQLLKDSKIAVVTALVPGRYRLLAVSAKGDTPSDYAECLVIVGNAPPVPPTPVPPGPGPQPPVPVPPSPAGPRALTIIRETADNTPAIARLVTALRNGPQSQYLASKSHRLYVFDDDSVGPDGKPSPGVEGWRSIWSGLTLPVLVIYDPVTRNVISKETLPATADAVIESVKKAGG